jgi:hypothetical protein
VNKSLLPSVFTARSQVRFLNFTVDDEWFSSQKLLSHPRAKMEDLENLQIAVLKMKILLTIDKFDRYPKLDVHPKG